MSNKQIKSLRDKEGYDDNITVEGAMRELGFSSFAEMSRYCGLSDKTLRRWRDEVSPVGVTLLNLLVEVKRLEDTQEKSDKLKKALQAFISE